MKGERRPHVIKKKKKKKGGWGMVGEQGAGRRAYPGFRIQGAGCKVQGSRFRVQGAGLWVYVKGRRGGGGVRVL